MNTFEFSDCMASGTYKKLFRVVHSMHLFDVVNWSRASCLASISAVYWKFFLPIPMYFNLTPSFLNKVVPFSNSRVCAPMNFYRLVQCIDPVKNCAGLIFEGNTDDHTEERRHQALGMKTPAEAFALAAWPVQFPLDQYKQSPLWPMQLSSIRSFFL